MDRTISTAKALGKLSIGFTPAGDVIDAYEVFTGKDFWSGQELGPWERAASGIGLLGGSGRFWRSMADEIRGVSKVEEVLEAARKLTPSMNRV